MSNVENENQSIFRRILPYIGASVVILGLVFVGSLSKNQIISNNSSSMNMTVSSSTEASTSADEISDMYVVANVSSSIELASTDAVSSNYVMSSVMHENGQDSAERVDKPNIVDTSGISRGVVSYTVADGDTMQSIAKEFDITTTQIRWSNGLQSEDITPGQTLSLPSVPGIVYTVKAGDTIEGISSRYGSQRSEIISVNDLENAETLTEGAQIVLPGGELPNDERPEVIATTKASVRATSAYTYTYSGSTSGRENMHVVYENVYTDPGNRMTPGQCVWYAWWWRKHSPLSLGALPDGMMGSANVWASVLAGYGYRVDHIPQVGAVFQTSSGYYGHVGVVIGINSNGSLLVREMNYGGRTFVVTESTIPANQVGNFNYIH